MQRKLDLRTGRSVWSASRAPAVTAKPLRRDVKTDVLVIGMGISGAMIAHALTLDGHAVVCVDRRGPLLGSTTATTALVQFEIDQPLTLLAKRMGRARAEQAWRRSRLSLGNLKAEIEREGIRCDLEERPSLYLDGNVLTPAALSAEAEARRAAGLDADYMTPKQLAEQYGIEGRSAIRGAGNLALEPRKLTAGFLKAAARRGARLHAPVEVIRIEHGPDAVVATTDEGRTIHAGHAVLATGYELMDAVPAAPHRIVSTWAIATRPQPRRLWPEQAMIWEAADPYLYMRTTRDGRIVCGGEDEDFEDEEKRDALIEGKTETISAKLKALFPGIDPEPEFRWAGAFGTTQTGLPIIGRVPRKPRLFAVMGYGGNGITYSRIAAELVRTALAGREDGDASLYAFPD